MSTKINVRSPFYASYSEPVEPSVELTCSLINLQNFSVDQFGNVTLPSLTYGEIVSYTSAAGDFSDGRFATVGSDTSRTVTFTIGIPPNFSNAANDTIDCSATATQPTYVCTGGVTTNGTIPNQSLDTGGDTVTIDLTSYFTQGVDPISYYKVTNNYLDYFDYTLVGDDLTIVSKNKAGTRNLYVEASDGDSLTCNATQSIQITITAIAAYTCTDSYLSGGLVAQDGTITNPSVNGTITAIKTSSGGTPITSLPANNTGSTIAHTLYFDITVPTGYSNTGATVECSKVFYQVSSALPEFTCSVAGLTGQAITSTGIIAVGTANVGTISRFFPISFPTVYVNTSRTVTYYITPPASGYSNSGGADVECNVVMTQPATAVSCGIAKLWASPASIPYMTIAQVQAAFPSASVSYWNSVGNSVEAALNAYGINSAAVIGSYASLEYSANSLTHLNNVNTVYCEKHIPLLPIKRTFSFVGYKRISDSKEYTIPTPAQLGTSYYYKIEKDGFITEIWFVDWINKIFTRIDNLQ